MKTPIMTADRRALRDLTDRVGADVILRVMANIIAHDCPNLTASNDLRLRLCALAGEVKAALGDTVVG